MKFTVTYHECYSGEYEVEANSKEEAEELVKEDIFNGRRPTPNECYDSGCQTVEVVPDDLRKRMKILKAKATDIKEKEEKIQDEKQKRQEELEQQIRDLQPRISDLLALANQCRELNIPFPNAVQTGKFYGNGKHNFFSDGFYHELGFMGYPFNYIQFLGYDMGGFCGAYDFFTDGAMIFSKHEKTEKVIPPILTHLEQFLHDFENFEKGFYQWIDSMEKVSRKEAFLCHEENK